MSCIKTVLISGAGVAGPTLAWYLSRAGVACTLVERAGSLRSSGSPVDVRGPAVSVAEEMGIMPALRAAASAVEEIGFFDDRAHEKGRVNLGALQHASGSREVEVPRGDLARCLAGAVKADAEFVFGDSIAALAQDGDGADVRFERGGERRFDLVIGADGLHSRVRRLAFGPETEFVKPLGLFIATLPLPDWPAIARRVEMYNAPGRSAAIHPSTGRALGAFIFRAQPGPEFDLRNEADQRRLIEETYAGSGWHVPAMLRALAQTDEMYFDAVCRVDLPKWSSGRVALLGDAASCVSLFGEGSSLAMAGARTLGEALSGHDDLGAGLQAYEARHRRLVAPRQKGIGANAAVLVPRTAWGIALRNTATRLWPLAAGAMWMGRAFGSRGSGRAMPAAVA
ncbi:oxidoreductase [Youhaiella tibetensis]|uniref:Monooxygenase n=1 Tax=Paradevosia tibetensis TaxID=1447062 RepID=A0A5B9DQT9_9HYPH|nr:FAD-dependent monooxygenase [Youhaiella tibetensis]QEE20734.1 monooxygenase [Youhaiella tibetensis]GGF21530.1 oxidoreductase [Youhaiella tibetensis]